MDPEEFVLENRDLRKEILKSLVKIKYREELSDWIKTMLNEEIIKNWFKFCQCEQCRIAVYRWINDIDYPI